MKPTISFHGIDSIKLTPVLASESGGPPFWSRTIVFTDKAGKRFSLALFSDSATGLLLPEETSTVEAQ